MSDIIINTTNLKTYESIMEMSKMYGQTPEDANLLWNQLLTNDAFMYEFIYYLEHGSLCDKLRVHNFTLSDIYVYQIGHYNLFISDIGKNYASCNKNAIVFDTFITMAKLIADIDLILDKLTRSLGNDIQ